jgi:hypothetical protein
MGQAQWHQPERVTAHVDASIVGCAALSIRVASQGGLSTCSGGSAADRLLGGNAELVPEGRERVGLVEVSAEGGIEDARGHRRRQRAREGDVDALHAATMNLVDSLQAPVRVSSRVVLRLIPFVNRSAWMPSQKVACGCCSGHPNLTFRSFVDFAAYADRAAAMGNIRDAFQAAVTKQEAEEQATDARCVLRAVPPMVPDCLQSLLLRRSISSCTSMSKYAAVFGVLNA